MTSAETIEGQDSRRDTSRIRAPTSRSSGTFDDRVSRREDGRKRSRTKNDLNKTALNYHRHYTITECIAMLSLVH